MNHHKKQNLARYIDKEKERERQNNRNSSVKVVEEDEAAKKEEKRKRPDVPIDNELLAKVMELNRMETGGKDRSSD